MAVTADSTPKSAPDSAKLHGMAIPIVTVTKGRKGASVSIMAGKKGFTMDDIMSLHESLPRMHGPGIYTFEVHDEAGDGKEKDKWTVQLGAVSERDDVAPIPTPGTISGNAQAFDGAKLIGPNLWYNAEFGMLINRMGEMHPWRPGTALPGSFAPPQPVAAAAPAATPWGMPGAPGAPPYYPPWGQYPAFGGEDERTKLLEKQLADEREARREAERRQELAAIQAAMDKQQQANDARFEKLLVALQEGRKETGPTATEREMQARLDAAERRADESRREAEAARREDSMRREIEASKAETARIVAELRDNKPDPMVPMLTQMMSNMQAGTATIVSAMQESGRATAETAREYTRLMTDRLGASALTPDKVFEMIKLAKDNGPAAEANKGLAEMYSTVFGMAKDLLILRNEMEGGGEPPWVGIARDGVQRIGAVAQAFATTKAREEARGEQAAAEAERQRRQALANQRHVMAQRAMAAQENAAVAGPAPVPQIDNRTEAQKIRDAAATRVFPGGANPAKNEREAAAAALNMDKRREPGEAAPAKRTRSKKAAAVAPPPPPAVVHLVDPSPDLEDEDDSDEDETEADNGLGVITAGDMSVDDVRAIVARFDDEQFFGSIFPHVARLRQEVANGLEVSATADYIVQATQMLVGSNEFPPAMELLQNQHLEVVVERLLPHAQPAYRDQLVATLRQIGDEADSEAAG